MRTNDEPAFPSDPYHTAGTSGGMSLRDYFAAKAMQAAIGKRPVHTHLSRAERDECLQQICEASYAIADAMLKERLK